jgi:hypothetical protein
MERNILRNLQVQHVAFAEAAVNAPQQSAGHAVANDDFGRLKITHQIGER